MSRHGLSRDFCSHSLLGINSPYYWARSSSWLANLSSGCGYCLLEWYSQGRCVHDTTSWLNQTRHQSSSMQTLTFTLRPQTKPTHLVCVHRYRSSPSRSQTHNSRLHCILSQTRHLYHHSHHVCK